MFRSFDRDDINRLTSQSDAFLSGTNNVGWTLGYNPASMAVIGCPPDSLRATITTETRDILNRVQDRLPLTPSR